MFNVAGRWRLRICVELALSETAALKEVIQNIRTEAQRVLEGVSPYCYYRLLFPIYCLPFTVYRLLFVIIITAYCLTFTVPYCYYRFTVYRLLFTVYFSLLSLLFTVCCSLLSLLLTVYRLLFIYLIAANGCYYSLVLLLIIILIIMIFTICNACPVSDTLVRSQTRFVQSQTLSP